MIVIIVAAGVVGYYEYSISTPSSTTTTQSSTSSTETQAQICASATGATPALYQQATGPGEGQVVEYGELDAGFMVPMVAAFNKVCPGINVQYLDISNAQLFDKVSAEVSANHVTFDMVAGPLDIMTTIEQAGYLTNFTVPNINQYPTAYRGDGTLGPYIEVTTMALYYNTKLLNSSQYPTSLTSLLSPVFKGRVAIGDPAALAQITDWLYNLAPAYFGNSTTQANAFITSLGQQAPILEPDNTAGMTDLLSGKALAAIDLASFAGRYYNCSCFDYMLLNPSPGLPHTLGIAAKAPHPAAAQLFADYLYSQTGMQYIAAFGWQTVVQGVTPAIPNYPTNFAPVPEQLLYGTDLTNMTSFYEGLLGGTA